MKDKGNSNIIIAIIVSLVVGALAGYFGGQYISQSQRQARFAQFGVGQGGGLRQYPGGGPAAGASGARQGFRPVSGKIISADKNSITVQLADGSSKIIILSDKTAINKAEKVDQSALTVGTTVAVFGTDNSDGSVTAQNVQINPRVIRVNQ